MLHSACRTAIFHCGKLFFSYFKVISFRKALKGLLVQPFTSLYSRHDNCLLSMLAVSTNEKVEAREMCCVYKPHGSKT